MTLLEWSEYHYSRRRHYKVMRLLKRAVPDVVLTEDDERLISMSFPSLMQDEDLRFAYQYTWDMVIGQLLQALHEVVANTTSTDDLVSLSSSYPSMRPMREVAIRRSSSESLFDYVIPGFAVFIIGGLLMVCCILLSLIRNDD